MIRITNPGRFITFIVALAILIVGAFMLLNVSNAVLEKSGEISIAPGAAAGPIWQELAAEGYTGSTLPWRYASWRQSAAAQIQAGVYTLEHGEHVSKVVRRFVNGDINPSEVSITYPEGFTLDQIAERTAAEGIGPKQAFLSASLPLDYVSRYSYLGAIPVNRGLEGYLFPDTYRVLEDDTPANVISRMLANFDQKFSDELRSEAQAQGRTIDQIVTMASIIEREVISDEDMALVSGVLWKRFDDGAGLDADATVRYALKKWDEPLTVQDLASDSPYNTRKWRGLPPGPISNPGLRALAAAVRPEESEFYYYLSAPTGETIFSRDLDEHNLNKAKYLQ